MRPAGATPPAGGPLYVLEDMTMSKDLLLTVLTLLAFVLCVTALALAIGWLMITALVLMLGSVVVLWADTNGGVTT